VEGTHSVSWEQTQPVRPVYALPSPRPAHIPPDDVVECGLTQRKPPEVRI